MHGINVFTAAFEDEASNRHEKTDVVRGILIFSIILCSSKRLEKAQMPINSAFAIMKRIGVLIMRTG